ncbi:hypothetical protein BS50DRAFT_299924 [Corynespora cassiicola Philippines]|uniref:Uncharacterized protein n=1 Tax=Corynespora cassiicola Philippines TaxID=1448308 RepID=A0A2T2NWX1_CORCC|nr:hypothetical protein BS50DRAFT_299924 [Corynespora cassiicola Philippines]
MRAPLKTNPASPATFSTDRARTRMRLSPTPSGSPTITTLSVQSGKQVSHSLNHSDHMSRRKNPDQTPSRSRSPTPQPSTRPKCNQLRTPPSMQPTIPMQIHSLAAVVDAAAALGAVVVVLVDEDDGGLHFGREWVWEFLERGLKYFACKCVGCEWSEIVA